MSVPVAGDTARAIGIIESRLWPSAVARPGERRLEFAFDHRLNELAHPTAQAGFDRVKPVIEKTNRGLGFQLQGQRLRAIAGHGVVSTRRANAGIVWVSTPGDYATLNSNHTTDGTRRFVDGGLRSASPCPGFLRRASLASPYLSIIFGR